MEPKSIKIRFKNRSKFQSDFGVVLGAFLVDFGNVSKTRDLQKRSSRVGEVPIELKTKASPKTKTAFELENELLFF